MTTGIVGVACLTAAITGFDPRHEEIDFQPNELRRERGEPLLSPLRKPPLEHDIPSLHVPELPQPLVQRALTRCPASPGVAVRIKPIRHTFPAGSASAASGAARTEG
jgi:hypothetical protein